jgi:transposase
MKESNLYLGLDVHSREIMASVIEQDGTERYLGVIPNRPESVRKLVNKLGEKERIRAVYEAGPTGYGLYWQLEGMGVSCAVAAPTLIPTKAGDRVKTNRRDAQKLARYHRSGDLSYVWVPDEAHEALRDLVRAREAAKRDEVRSRQRLKSFLLRHGLRAAPGVRAWSAKYRAWLEALTFDRAALAGTFQDYLHEIDHHELRVKRLEAAIEDAVEQAPERFREVVAALQSLRGVRKTTAVGVAAEVGSFSRFEHPQQLMGYSGAVPSENSTGDKHRRGSITKTGNSHLRRLVGESAWSYRYRPSLRYALKKRQEGQPAEVVEISWRAQVRLCGRYQRLVARGKAKQKVVTAVARELLGFMWAIGVEVERRRGEITNSEEKLG